MSVRREQIRSKKSGTVRTRWMIDIDITMPDGKTVRIRKVSPIPTQKGAKEYERELRQSVLAGTYGKEQSPASTIREFSAVFMEMHAEVSNKPSEVAAKQSVLDVHILPALGDVLLDQVDDLKIARFKSAQRAKGLAPKTINNHLIVLQTLLSKAVEWNKLERAPKIAKLPRMQPEITFLSFAEARQLEAAVGAEPLDTAVVVALHVGLRRGELIGLQWGDVDFQKRRLTVRRAVWNGEAVAPKSGKERTVQLNAKAIAALQATPRRGTWVWSMEDGNSVPKDAFTCILERALKRAGLHHIGWHTLRHTFASHLVMRGAPIVAVQQALGHSSIGMTMRYSHLMPEIGGLMVDLLLDQPSLRQPDGNAAPQQENDGSWSARLKTIGSEG